MQIGPLSEWVLVGIVALDSAYYYMQEQIARKRASRAQEIFTPKPPSINTTLGSWKE